MQTQLRIKEIVDQTLNYLRSGPPLKPLEAFALLVGLLTMVYSMLSYRLQKKFLKRSFEHEADSERVAREQNERLEAEAKRRIPHDISMSNEILVMWTMKDAGIPEGLAYLGIFDHKAKKGEWVNRGDTLLTVRYEVFRELEKPRWWFLRDERFSTEVSLKSPVSGLVISFTRERVGSGDRFSGVLYGETDAFPVILLPEKEPTQDRWVKCFYGYMNDRLRQYWPLIAYHDGYGGSMRVKDKMPDLKPQLLKELRVPDFIVRKIGSTDNNLLNEIQLLRGKPELQHLHTKLKHLVP